MLQINLKTLHFRLSAIKGVRVTNVVKVRKLYNSFSSWVTLNFLGSDCSVCEWKWALGGPLLKRDVVYCFPAGERMHNVIYICMVPIFSGICCLFILFIGWLVFWGFLVSRKWANKIHKYISSCSLATSQHSPQHFNPIQRKICCFIVNFIDFSN